MSLGSSAPSYPKVDAADDLLWQTNFTITVYLWESVSEPPVSAGIERASAQNVSHRETPGNPRVSNRFVAALSAYTGSHWLADKAKSWGINTTVRYACADSHRQPEMAAMGPSLNAPAHVRYGMQSSRASTSCSGKFPGTHLASFWGSVLVLKGTAEGSRRLKVRCVYLA